MSNKGAVMKKIIAGVVLLLFSRAGAELFTFNLLQDGAPWDNAPSGVYTNVQGGKTLEASLFAYLDGSYSPSSRLNATSTDFGINAPSATDQSALFDTQDGQEALWVSFNHSVTVKSFTVSSFATGNTETGAWQVAEGSVTPFTASGTYTVDTALAQGSFFKVIALDQGGGNGWRLSSFTVESVPEPASLALIGLGGFLLHALRRRSRQ
jgi:hypothetical protein